MMKHIKFFVSVWVVAMLFGCNNLSSDLNEKNDDESRKNLLENSNYEGTSSVTDEISSASEERFQEFEIRNYYGVKLDPIIGPRDNSISGVQIVDITNYELRITGLVMQEKLFTYEKILELESYKKLITLYCVEGWEATTLWEGIRIKDLIELAEVKEEANTVIFKAVDGYTTALPLEIIIEKDMLLAFNANGIVLPPEMGYPFIVVAEDRLGYKWARWVNEIELSDNEYYLGYWEKRGNSNHASISPKKK